MLPLGKPAFDLPASFTARKRFGRSVRIDVDEKGIAREDRHGQRRLRWMDVNRFVTSRGDMVAFTDGAGGQLGIPSGIDKSRLLLDIIKDRIIDAHAWRVRRMVHGPTADVPFYQPRKIAYVLLATAFAIAAVASWFSFRFYFTALLSFISGVVYLAFLPTSIVVGPTRVEIRSRMRTSRLGTDAIREVWLRILEDRGPVVLLLLADGQAVELRGYGSALSLYDRLRLVTPPRLESTGVDVTRQFNVHQGLPFLAAAAALTIVLTMIPILNGRAVSEGSTFLPPQAVGWLIDMGTPVDASGVDGRSAAYNAAKFGRIDMLTMLLAKGANPSRQQTRSPGFTPLHVAAEYNQIEAVRILLAAGVSPNVRNHRQQTPLMQLATLGHRQEQERPIAEMLIAAGADVNAKDYEGFTVAHDADEPEVMWLIALIAQHGADLNVPNAYAERPLDRAMRDKKPFYVRALAAAGADVNVNLNNSDHPWLHDKVLASDNELIKVLLECGAKPDFVDDVGYTTLSAAAKLHNLDATRMLLAAGADPNQSTPEVGTALRIAVIENQPDIVRELLAHGASPNVTFRNTSPLQLAAVELRTDIVGLLLDAGANPNFSSEESASALFIAAERGGPEMVNLLLRRGADPNQPFKGRFTPMMAAMRSRDQRTQELLRAAGAHEP